MKVYLAAPLFTEEDKQDLDIVENICKSLSIDFFSPRIECAKYVFPDKTQPDFLKNRDIWATNILQENIRGIDSCELLLANTRDFDPGTIWEMGYAFSSGKPIISYTFKRYGLNIMLSQTSLKHIDTISHRDFDDLAKTLKLAKDSHEINFYEKDKYLEVRAKLFNLTDIDLF